MRIEDHAFCNCQALVVTFPLSSLPSLPSTLNSDDDIETLMIASISLLLK
jgi:hypothetical protein